MPPIIHNNFNPETVELAGSNLIEASAGTGKTYSIALLTLRLIIEKNIPIQKILMVTFTKAAVAELELRVRSFIRQSLKASRLELIEDPTITRLVNNQIQILSREEVEKRLATAQLFLDETSVLTIHSFCQRTLSEFSFETSQIFGAETISPDEFNQITEDAFNDFWRQRVTTIKVVILEKLLGAGLKHSDVLGLVKQALSGKILATATPIPVSFLDGPYQNALADTIYNQSVNIDNLNYQIVNQLLAGKTGILNILTTNTNAKKAFDTYIREENWLAVIETIYEKRTVKYVDQIFGTILTNVIALYAVRDTISLSMKTLINHITVFASESVKQAILEVKLKRGIITFDDMILLLYNAVINGINNQILIDALRRKYDAVFIDEFQDTDREQYAVFEKLFNIDKILFYIGDPKQSIYAFRKADIFTYFTASNSVQNLHKMNTNHRSTKEYIDAMNEFFQPTPGFDTFSFSTDPIIPNAIQYLPVSSPQPNLKGRILYQGAPIKPIKISAHDNKRELNRGIKGIITDLLTPGNYSIEKNNATRNIKLSDIGILVRTKKEAAGIKSILAAFRIPAVTIDDTRLLESDEAKQLFYILDAVNDISRANINRALLTSIGGYNQIDLLQADEEAILQQFRIYQESWKSKGIYLMLRQFLADHRVNERLYNQDSNNPERTIANIQQLVEIIHKVSERKNYEPKELIQWLKKGMEGDTREGDEYEQRIESDDEAVKIVTIHKSKGLEYNIVIAPHLDLLPDSNFYTTGSYRSPIDGNYYISNKPLPTDENRWYLAQSEQENRRLLYVAITRARYQCFITASNASYYSKSSLRTFCTALTQVQHVEFWIPPTPNSNFTYAVQQAQSPEYAIAQEFNLIQSNWIKTSYSGLNPEHTNLPVPKSQEKPTNSYDQFVFQDLKKGAHTGNLLHYIFENIDFVNSANWPRVVQQALKRLSSNSNEAYAANIVELLQQVTSMVIPGTDFSLNQITKAKRLNELEFDFLLKSFNTAALEQLSTPEHPFRIRSIAELEGIMNGKMDLFFEHNGKYYILDWKSNFLGNTLEDYSTEKVKAAMYENNYHLQYLIYTVALTKFLTLRKANFDYDRDFGGVIYLFLRGVRGDEGKGALFVKPNNLIIASILNLIS
jgi:exodeoxyribonuclease V beta subunit